MERFVPAPLTFRETTFDFHRACIFGVLNLTPDSFSDGGRFGEPEAAVAHAEYLVQAGADVIDIGGESTAPNARPVSAEVEMARVLPVIRALAMHLHVPISVDTTKAVVAEAAIGAGAQIVNDVSGGHWDSDMVQVVEDAGAAYVCGHVRGSDITSMHASIAQPPEFDAIASELAARLNTLPASLRARTIADPCLGFGKGCAQNVELIARAGELAQLLDCPVMFGASRKRFLGELTGEPLLRRDDATVGASLAAAAAGAHVLRVHDVSKLHPALRVFEAASKATR